MIAAIFQTETAEEKLGDPTTSDDKAWEELLQKLETTARQKAGPQRVYIDGLIRIVSDQDILIIKKNERRLWTRSAARDDAEATIVAVIQMHSANGTSVRTFRCASVAERSSCDCQAVAGVFCMMRYRWIRGALVLCDLSATTATATDDSAVGNTGTGRPTNCGPNAESNRASRNRRKRPSGSGPPL